MQFAIMFDTHVDKWELIRYVEELGYDRAYVPDSEMIWSDCYATLALAAANTKRIQIGTGIAAAGVRIAPVTAHSIATINQLAPGRVFLGIGTGNTSMRMMGQNPTPVTELREYMRVVRKLLDGEEVDYTYRGKTRRIQFIHRDRHYINLDNRIPIYMAALLPKALELAGEAADGWITVATDPARIGEQWKHIRAGAHNAGRTIPVDFHTTFVTAGCVLRPGERLSDDRVINETGSQVACDLHETYEIWLLSGRKDEVIPPWFADIFHDYVKRVDNYSLPPEARFRQIHNGHCTFLQPEERRFITPAAIAELTFTGEPGAIIERLRKMERAGLKEVILLQAADYQRKVYRDFAEMIIPAFR
ncbi:MAG: LLM class flavin-dependent oxidoreductase [Candidatus Binataceae bacterium]